MKPDRDGMATCACCNKYKPITQFRKYYPRKGSEASRDSLNYYKYCKSCEGLDSKYKRLCKQVREGTASKAVMDDYYKFNALWAELHAHGRWTSSMWKTMIARDAASESIDMFDGIRDALDLPALPKQPIVDTILNMPTDTPQDLVDVLHGDLTPLNLEELDILYEHLATKYKERDMVRGYGFKVRDTFAIHADTIEAVLDRIDTQLRYLDSI